MRESHRHRSFNFDGKTIIKASFDLGLFELEVLQAFLVQFIQVGISGLPQR